MYITFGYASSKINLGCTTIGYTSSDIDLLYTAVRYARWIQEKSPHQNCSLEKSPQISPLEKTPQSVLQPVEKSPHPFWGLVEKSPQFYKKALK